MSFEEYQDGLHGGHTGYRNATMPPIKLGYRNRLCCSLTTHKPLWVILCCLPEKGRKKNSVITCNRVAVLALCTISNGHLSMYKVSFDSLLYFQRYAADKFNIAKIRKGNNSINTDNRIMVLAFDTSPHSPLSVYQVSFIYLQYFKRDAPDKLTIAKIRMGNNSVITCDKVTVLAL